MTIALTRYGSKIEVVVDGAVSGPMENPEDIALEWIGDGTVDVSIDSRRDPFYENVPAANLSLGGVAITSLGVYKTQLALVFPNANQGGGTWGTITGTLTDQTDLVTYIGTSGGSSIQTKANDTAAFAALTNSQGSYFEVGGAVSYYAKNSTGITNKLTLPVYP